MSSETGTSVYYTTDGTNPSTSSTNYSTTPIDASVVANATGATIKAFAVDDTDNTKVSKIITIPLVTYTYHIVNQSKEVAITKTVKQAVGTALSGYSSIPKDIRSSYISDETVTFYSFDGTYNVGDIIPVASTFDISTPIEATPADNSNIYVR